MYWGNIADWAVATTTLLVAIAAIWQKPIRALWHHPELEVTTKTGPPDCVMVQWTKPDGTPVAQCIFLRVWVKNAGSARAKNVEIYAEALRRKRKDGGFETVAAFPPMNLKWANTGGLIYFATISPGMGKHCDVGHITDPARRHLLHEHSQSLQLTDAQTSLAFDLQTAPNHKGHIIAPGDYHLDVLVAASNRHPIKCTLEITMDGNWIEDETRMLRDHVGIKVLPRLRI